MFGCFFVLFAGKKLTPSRLNLLLQTVKNYFVLRLRLRNSFVLYMCKRILNKQRIHVYFRLYKFIKHLSRRKISG